MRMTHVRIDLAEANSFVSQHHRHHKPVVGHLFSLGAVLNNKIVGVAIVGRPVSRMRDDGMTVEVTRLCTDGTKNACSFLYGATAKAAFALGFTKIGTYILASEPGTSLIGTGWKLIGERGGGSWSVPSRPRVDKHPTQKKLLFERARNAEPAYWDRNVMPTKVVDERAERLRLELEKIAWMDEFLDADGAKAMMNIAREAINNDN